jgi:cytochrome c biogenesis protein CcmG, thiol:disulfide interchange protein DsbE
MKLKALIPLLLFVGLAVFLGQGLTRDPRLIPSPLIDKPAPHFSLPQLHAPEHALSLADMHGKVWLLNVWASWCASCRDEHASLVDFAGRGLVPIIGLDYKDKREDALDWLNQFGNPYAISIMDTDGRVGIDYGVYGVPETFLIDRNGRIRHKVTGPLTPDIIEHELLPRIKALQNV